MSAPKNATISSVSRFAVGLAVCALVAHTWFVMGLVVPVTVAGSSMAPTLQGPRECYRCAVCRREFAIGVDQLAAVDAICPDCGNWSKVERLGPAPGDRILVDRTAFLWQPPQRWEIAVFRSPVDEGELCVKRIVGLPGEVVAIADGRLLIDCQAIEVPGGKRYELRPGDDRLLSEGRQLGPSEYFVLGDNAAISDDCRSWPTGVEIDEKLLIGRPIGVR